MLKAMNDAGWPVEEPTLAALIAIVGFFYARAPSPIDTALATDQISQALQEKIKPVIHLDFLETFKNILLEAMVKAITRTALILTGALLALTVYGTHQIDAKYFKYQQATISNEAIDVISRSSSSLDDHIGHHS